MAESAVTTIKNQAATEVAVSGAMTIDMILELKDRLHEAFHLGKKVRLSLAGVTELDLTGLQLICSAHRTAIAKELELSVEGGDGEAVASVARLSGMPRHMGCARDVGDSCVWKRRV